MLLPYAYNPRCLLTRRRLRRKVCYCWDFIVLLGYVHAWLANAGCVGSCRLETARLSPPRCIVNSELSLPFCVIICGLVLNAVIHYWISVSSESYAASNMSPGFVRLSWVLMQVPWKVGSHAIALNRAWNSPLEGSRSTNCYFQRITKLFYSKGFISFLLYLPKYINRIQSLFLIFKNIFKKRTLQSYYYPLPGISKLCTCW